MKRNCLLALYHLRSNLMFVNGFLKSTSLRNENGLLQKKSKRGIRTKFWKKNPGIFRFATLPSEILEKAKLHPWKFSKIVWHPLDIPRPKTKTHKIPHDFILITPGNSYTFLLTPRIFTCSFFNTSRNPMPCPQPPYPWIFTGIITHTSRSYNTWKSTTK